MKHVDTSSLTHFIMSTRWTYSHIFGLITESRSASTLFPVIIFILRVWGSFSAALSQLRLIKQLQAETGDSRGFCMWGSAMRILLTDQHHIQKVTQVFSHVWTQRKSPEKFWWCKRWLELSVSLLSFHLLINPQLHLSSHHFILWDTFKQWILINLS